MGYPKMEKLPKAATASDRTGEKMVKVSKVDREGDGVPSHTGAKAPKAALSSDTSGEKRRPIEGGVGMGKMDGIGMRESSHMGKHDGRMGEMKGEVSEKTCYEHQRG
jgi:hypothetical protein